MYCTRTIFRLHFGPGDQPIGYFSLLWVNTLIAGYIFHESEWRYKLPIFVKFPISNIYKTCNARETPWRINRRISSAIVRRHLRQRNLRCRRPIHGSIYYGPNNAWTGLRGGGIQFYFQTSGDFVLTGPTGANAYSVGGASDRCIREHDRWSGPRDMVWGGTERLDLVVLERNVTARPYISDVLEEHAIPFIEQHPNLRIFSAR